MNEQLKSKAETMFYFLTKEAARQSFVEFLEGCDVTQDEWSAIKQEITGKTGIEFKYL